jgi:tetratricopeptide (TPR) repeat protein
MKIRFNKRPGLGLGLALAALCLMGVAAPSFADDLRDGRAALQAGRLDDALKSFEKAAQQGLAAGRAGVGQVHLRRRQFDKAMEAFKTAQRMDPNLALPYWGQGETLKRQGKCEEAIPLLVKANDLDRKFPEAKLALGDCYIATKQFDKGVATLSDGLKWGPKLAPRFLVALGNAEASRDSLRDAGIYFTRAREQAPDDPVVRRALGEFYVQRGTWALAVLELEAALAMDTSDVETRFSLGQALNYADRPAEALTQYRLVTARDPEFAPAQLALGALLYRAGIADPHRYVEAREPLERYVKMQPNDGRGWSVLGRVYYNLSRVQGPEREKLKSDASAAMAKARALGDKSKDMAADLGAIYASEKKWPEALQAFEEAGEMLQPKDRIIQAQVYVFAGQPEKADSVYLAIVEKDSTSSDARWALAEYGKRKFAEAARTTDAAQKSARYEQALGIFQRRNALDPKSGDAYFHIGLIHKEMKRYPEAMDALVRASELDSAKADRFFWRGVIEDALKKSGDARRSFERTIALDDTSKLAGKAHRQVGFYLLLDKDWSGAVRHLNRAVELDDKDVQAWVWLGQGYQNSGNREKAMEAYRKALALDPNQPDASKGIRVLSGGSASSGKGGTP